MAGREGDAVGWAWLLLPLIGAVIGWSTNAIAVRMLFRPRRPWRFPLTSWSVQGLLPRRRPELARVIGETVARDLFSTDTMIAHIQNSGYRDTVAATVSQHVKERLSRSLPRFVPQPLANAVTTYVLEVTDREMGHLLDRIETGVADTIRDNVPVAKIVEEKVLSLDLTELERLVLGVATRELRHIEALGAILGFLIGLVQAALVSVL